MTKKKGCKSYSLLSNQNSWTYSKIVFHSVLENSDHEYDIDFEYVKCKWYMGASSKGKICIDLTA